MLALPLDSVHLFTMNLVALSIKRPVFAWILMSALIIFGALALMKTGVSQMPDIDFPVLDISVTYEGAAPEVVEEEIVKPIEERLLGIEGVKEMRGYARQGSGSVRLEFDIHRNIDVALQEVQTALSQIRLPNDVDPPVIRKTNPEEEPIIILAVWADAPLKEVISWTENFLLDQLRFLPGMGEVSVGGFSVRNLRVWVDPKKLALHDLTVSDVLDALSSQHIETAAGQMIYQNQEWRVRSLGEAANIDEVAGLPILRRGGQLIQSGKALRISDVARVEDGLSDIRRMARIDGKEAIALQVRKQRGSNEVQLSEQVQKKLEELKSMYPPGYNVRVNVDFTTSTKSIVSTTIQKLWMAALITIFICFLFLGNLQSSLNILFSIPTSILGTFILLYFAGFTLNLFTLLALTLAISIVVDDAIMMLENIIRHSRMGKSAAQAAYDGSMEVLPSATAATLAVIAVFIPVLFMGGVIGKFFFQFGVAMSAAVLLSLVEAVTITPMRAAAFLKDQPTTNRFENWLEYISEIWSAKYKNSLRIPLQYPLTTVLAATCFFGLSLLFLPKLKKEFVPSQDQNIIILSGSTPPGTSLQKTFEKSLEVENVIKAHPDVSAYLVNVGAGPGGGSVNSLFMPIFLKERKDRKLGHNAIMQQLREQTKEIKGVRLQMRDISARNLTSSRPVALAFNLRGPDLQKLNEVAEQMSKQLLDEKLAADLDTDFKLGLPELIVEPQRNAIASYGVNTEALGKTLSVALGGVRQGRFTNQGERYDVRVKVPDELMSKPGDIAALNVRNVAGNLVPVSRVVTIDEKKSILGINRVNRQRAIGLFGSLPPGVSQAAATDRAKEIAQKLLPAGYSFQLDGAASGFQEAFQGLSFVLLIGIVVAYMILAIQFNSFVHPFSVLAALPFALSGAFITIWLFDVSLNLFSYIGLIVLMGIAKKNSIMMVEFTNQIRELSPQISVKQALLDACSIRLRPIIMTSVATIAAAIPLIWGRGMGIETRLPLGLTIIGGTFVSTVFTLFVVPALYLVLTRTFERKKHVELKTQNTLNELRLH